jgi:hypothetical protein
MTLQLYKKLEKSTAYFIKTQSVQCIIMIDKNTEYSFFSEIKKIVFKYPLQFCQKKAHCIKK